MSKTANINVRIDPDLKARVEKLYGSFGLSVTDAINLSAACFDNTYPLSLFCKLFLNIF